MTPKAIQDGAKAIQLAAEEHGVHIRFLVGTFDEDGVMRYINIGDKEWPHRREVLESLIAFCQRQLAEME